MTPRTFFSRAVLLAFLLLPPSSILQAQELEWVSVVRPQHEHSAFSVAGISVDQDGNSFVAGNLTEIVPPDSEDADPIWLQKIRVEKYAPDGTILWAASAGRITYEGSDGTMAATGIAIDSRGNSYVTGSFNGTVVFAAGEPNETVLTFGRAEGPFWAVFVAKYAPEGALEWVEIGRSGAVVFPSGGITTDASGNSYLAGSFEESTTSGARTSMFVDKYDADGNLLWTTGAPDHAPRAIATDPGGEIYVAGDTYLAGGHGVHNGQPRRLRSQV